MTRISWTTLPPEVRAAVESTLTVGVIQAIPADHTRADVAELLELETGKWLFLKGVQVPPGETTYLGVQLAKEARVLPQLPHGAAPALRFCVDIDGWRLLGTDFVHGDRATLAPQSRDVETVIHGLAGIAVNPRVARTRVCTLPNLAHSFAAEEPWRRLHALNPARLDEWTYGHLVDFASREPDMITMCAGYALVHNAIHPTELVVTRGGWLCVLDWRHAQVGPPWVDLATLATVLIEQGHDPDKAEELVGRNAVWQTGDAAAITAHAVQTYGLWELRRVMRPHHPGYAMKAAAWRAWAAYRWEGYRARHRRL